MGAGDADVLTLVDDTVGDGFSGVELTSAVVVEVAGIAGCAVVKVGRDEAVFGFGIADGVIVGVKRLIFVECGDHGRVEREQGGEIADELELEEVLLDGVVRLAGAYLIQRV